MVLCSRRPRTVVGYLVACRGPVRSSGLGAWRLPVASWGGGFPVKVNGEVVGAIGVSGAPTVQNDVDCARAALALVPDAVPAD